MSTDNKDTQAATPADTDEVVARPRRAPYAKPALTKLGNVNDLTLAVRATPLSDGGGKNTMAM